MSLRPLLFALGTLPLAALWHSPARAADAPLPESKDVLQRLIEHAQQADENDRRFEQGYRYTRTETTEVRNGKGDLKKSESKEHQHDPARVKAADSESSDAQPDDTDSKGRRHKSSKADAEEPEISDALLKRFQFKVVAREMISNRMALKLVFSPAPGVKTGGSMADRVMSRIAGELWVDEADSALVKITVRLTEPVNILAGIAGSLRAFTFQTERSRTADGLWFERLSSWHVEAREFLLNRVMDGRQEISDVKPCPSPSTAVNPLGVR